MKYIVVEKKEGYGWLEHIECQLESDANKIVEQLYKDAKRRNEDREFKVIEVVGEMKIPEDNPRKTLGERLDDKISKIIKA